MRENDGRKLDHQTLEAMRLRAVDAVKSVLSATTIAEVADREAQAAGAQMYYI